MKKWFYLLRLQRFAEGGSEGAGTGDTSQDAAGSAGEATPQDAAAQETQKATFEEMLKANPDYKEAYDKSMQKAIRQRFAKAKAAEDRWAKAVPILNVYAAKYGVDPEDLDAMQEAVDKDYSLYEERAYGNGLTVEQQIKMDKLTAENNRLREERQAEALQRSREAWLRQREAEAAELKQEFPDFDLSEMMQNERFVNLIHPDNQYAIPMREAYIAMNADGILQGAMSYTAKQVAKKTATTIAQRGSRPVEGGMSGQASAKVATDVSKLSNAEIAEYVLRAQRGEHITL